MNAMNDQIPEATADELKKAKRIFAEIKLESAVSDAMIQANKEGLTTSQINAILRRLSSVRPSY